MQTLDPDVVTGWNIYGCDFSFMLQPVLDPDVLGANSRRKQVPYLQHR